MIFLYLTVKRCFLQYKKNLYIQVLLFFIAHHYTFITSLTTRHFHFSTLITKHKKLKMISLSSTIISVSQSLVVNSIQGANCLEKVGSTHVVLHVGSQQSFKRCCSLVYLGSMSLCMSSAVTPAAANIIIY